MKKVYAIDVYFRHNNSTLEYKFYSFTPQEAVDELCFEMLDRGFYYPCDYDIDRVSEVSVGWSVQEKYVRDL